MQRSVALIVFIALLFGTAISGKHCRPSDKVKIWKHEGGTFKRMPNGVDWQEFSKEGNPGNKFVQIQTEGSSVVIHDKERDLDILLRDDLAGLRNKEEEKGKFQQLYQGGWVQVLDCT